MRRLLRAKALAMTIMKIDKLILENSLQIKNWKLKITQAGFIRLTKKALVYLKLRTFGGRFFKMSTNIKSHAQQKTYNNNFTYNKKECWVNIKNIHSLYCSTTGKVCKQAFF